MMPTTGNAGPDLCERCGGFMVPERMGEADSGGWRCVACGEVVDPVITAHRRQRKKAERPREPQHAAKLAHHG